MSEDVEKSLSDEATFAGEAKPLRLDMSLSDERTLGGREEAGIDTVIDDIEVVDLEARYRIEGTLGQGGMGAVLLATDTRLDRNVAIKRIIGEAARSATAIQRFLTEAKAIAALNHPNIVQIYDYGRAKDGPFLIMEYVDGGSLADRCKQGALPPEEAIELACQLCDGLGKAHDAGIIHRDIKPANVLLSKDNLPKLTDFGLAKAERSDQGMTMTGAVMGTPDFMPPEQRRDASLVDARSDLWSLAATVYQMLTGRSPKIIRFDQLPSSLTGVFGKALEDEKDERYQTARDFRDALRAGIQNDTKPSEDIGEGHCPACGVKNDSSRRFCRGCGESLEVPCLSCAKPMPMWEKICGSCGEQQSSVLETLKSTLAEQQSRAEAFLEICDYSAAKTITTDILNTTPPQLSHLSDWANRFLDLIEQSRNQQITNAIQLTKEAFKHEEAYDYISAALTLEAVPDSLRDTSLPDLRETVATWLARLQRKQADVRKYDAIIKDGLKNKEYTALLAPVEALLALKPDRADLKKLHAKLSEAHDRLLAKRDGAIATSKQLFEAKKYSEVIRTLHQIPKQHENAAVQSLRRDAQTALDRLKELTQIIAKQRQAHDYKGLTDSLHKFLELKPHDKQAEALLKDSRAREESRETTAISMRKKAEQEFQAGKIADAIKTLSTIDTNYRTRTHSDLLATYNEVLSIREAAVHEIHECRINNRFEPGWAIREYISKTLLHGITDETLQEYQDTVNSMQEAAENDQRRKEARARLNSVFLLVILVIVIVIAAIRAWMTVTDPLF